ncbi:hypothetical protein V8B97DRAFT_1917213 [Scleroderma yunnanense]
MSRFDVTTFLACSHEIRPGVVSWCQLLLLREDYAHGFPTGCRRDEALKPLGARHLVWCSLKSEPPRTCMSKGASVKSLTNFIWAVDYNWLWKLLLPKDVKGLTRQELSRGDQGDQHSPAESEHENDTPAQYQRKSVIELTIKKTFDKTLTRYPSLFASSILPIHPEACRLPLNVAFIRLYKDIIIALITFAFGLSTFVRYHKTIFLVFTTRSP